MHVRRPFAVLLVAAAALAAGCGAEAGSDVTSADFPDPDRRAVAAAVTDFSDAARQRDYEQICADYLAAPLVKKLDDAKQTARCPDQLERSLRDVDETKLAVRNVRNWLFVEDFARGIGHVLEHGVAGEVYNVGGPDEEDNLTVVRRIIEIVGGDPDELIAYVTDRPGHDRRYSLGSEKVRALGWEAQVRFEEGLERTVDWYRDNPQWWQPIRSGDYRAYYERQYGTQLG